MFTGKLFQSPVGLSLLLLAAVGCTPKEAPPQETSVIPVTYENFVRAESDKYFRTRVTETGTGKFYHFHQFMPIDKQTVIRGNRDTLYSSGVFDLKGGPVTVTLPDPGSRFMSMIAIDEDQYAAQTVYAPGTFTFAADDFKTRYILLGIRTFVDPNDPADFEKAFALQDAVKVEQASAGSFESPNWDPVSQKAVRDELIKRAASIPDTKGMFGPRGTVDPERHLVGTATGWGGNAEKDAMYLMVVPSRNDGRTVHTLTVKEEVPVDAFWSVSVYGADGYFHKNELDAYTINNLTAQKQKDGSVRIQFGDCDGSVPNCMPITEGWNYWVRLYRPRQEILGGTYRFPEAQPAQ